ncbi:MAG: hypothetical protein ACE5G5_08975 [Candidatus Methylomirabilales bacterium]
MRIGIDIDDVLADSLPAFLEGFNRRFGLEIPVTEAGWEIFQHHPEIPAAEVRAFFAELTRTDFLASRPILTGAREGVERLYQAGHRLFVITGRLRQDRGATERWLEVAGLSSFFQEIADRDGVDTAVHKWQAAERLRLDALVEDEYDVALSVAKLSVRVLLFDRPWNQGSLPPRVTRIHSWVDVLTYFGRQDTPLNHSL